MTVKYFETPNGYINDKELQVHTIERYKPRNNLNPLDWRHHNYDLLAPIGKDIFINNLPYKQIARKYEITDRTVDALAKRLQPKHLERVPVSSNQKWEWRPRKTMKVKLEFELENRAWSTSELIFALGETLRGMETAEGKTNAPWTGHGPITDRQGKAFGTYEVTK